MFHVPERYRITSGPAASNKMNGNNGAFLLPPFIGNRLLAIIASDDQDWELEGLPGEPWEHVSVHVLAGKRDFTPTWAEMAYVKRLFWDEEDLVVQFHPPKSDYVNTHPFTLHLWRPTKSVIPLPPRQCV